MHLTAAQIRAARGILGWTREEISSAAGIAAQTLKNIERGVHRPQDATINALVRFFALHDISFAEHEGVRRERNHVKTFCGPEGVRDFLDNIYAEMRDCGGEMRQFNVNDDFLYFAGEYAETHLERMSDIKNLNAKALLSRGSNKLRAGYSAYRWMNKNQTLFIPYYVYGKTLALFSAKDENDIEVVAIKSELLSSIFIEQFDVLWEIASPPPKER